MRIIMKVKVTVKHVYFYTLSANVYLNWIKFLMVQIMWVSWVIGVSLCRYNECAEKEVTSQTEEISLCGQVWHLSGLQSASHPRLHLQVQLAHQFLQTSAFIKYK